MPIHSTGKWIGRLVLLASAGSGCHQSTPPAALTSAVADSAGISIITLGRPLADVAQGRAGAANDSATLLFELDSLEHPVAVAFRSTGEVAVVDRAEFNLSVFDSTGNLSRVLGRHGDGPGEFRIPAGVAAVGGDLVVLQSWPGNMLERFSVGAPPDAVTPQLPGDWNGWMWQRPDIGLEYRSQSAPELWSRRLRAFDDSSFVVYLGPIDSDTSSGARAHLLRFGRDLRLRDTVATLPADRRERRPNPDGRGLPELFKPVWGEHTVWTSGNGALALARSDAATVEIRGAEGKLTQIIRWTPLRAPVTPDDRHALGEYLSRVTLSVSPSAVAMKAKMSDAEIEAMMDQVMASYQLTLTRPELTALFLADRCLWMAGFDVHDDADGTAHEWLVLDLDHPNVAPRVVTIGGPTERVVAIERGKAATILLKEDGSRQVRVYRVPSCGSG